MVITSKYNGKCTACAARVLKGMQVNWVRGVKGVTHADCENPQEGMEGAEPEQFAFKPEPGTVQVGFSLHTMTPAQLKALRDIVSAELEMREQSAEKQAA